MMPFQPQGELQRWLMSRAHLFEVVVMCGTSTWTPAFVPPVISWAT